VSESHGTTIEWTHGEGFKGETWNPTTGCDRVSPGCAHCYALTLAARLKAMGSPAYQKDGDPKTSGPGFGLTLHEDRLELPLRWKKPRMVFVNSMSDLFHEEIPDEFVRRVFAVMASAPRHIFQVLTKRPERARDLLRLWYRYPGQSPEYPLPNVWLGVSIENARYTYRADVLREIPAAVRFISAEPLLGSLFPASGEPGREARGPGREQRATEGSQASTVEPPPLAGKRPLDLTGIDWLIVGGESGKGARPMDLDWARELIDAAAHENLRRSGPDVPISERLAVFVKQLGARPVESDGMRGHRVVLRDRKGGKPDEWPEDMRVREMPEVTHAAR
jgi:protein gp37